MKTQTFMTILPRLRNSLIIVAILVGLFGGFGLRAQAPDRTKPPDVGPPPALRLAKINHLKLSNGLAVVFMEKHEVPLVQMQLIVRAGTISDPEGKTGLANMTSGMMREGAGKRNSLQLDDAIDFLGASIEVFSGYHTTNVSMHSTLPKFDSTLALFADVALRPTFPKEELERQRLESLTSLLQWHDEPRAIAGAAYPRLLFGESHPYGRSIQGTEQSLRSFQVSDLKSFYNTWFHPNNATLIVVGDLTKEKLLPKLEAAFGKWKKADVPKLKVEPVPQVAERKVFIVDKPGAAQSEIRIGRIGVERMTSDYYALVVMNTILGGSFTSRLNNNLRETHGYTYGAGSRFDFRPSPGPFTASAAVQTNVTDSSLVQFMIELKGILEPVSETDLSRAKNFCTLRYPENFETVGQITGQLSDLAVFSLPDAYFNNYVKNIMAVTAQDVNRVAKKYIDPDKVDILIVGDRSKIEQGVAALNLGPIQNMTIDDVLGKAPVLSEGK